MDLLVAKPACILSTRDSNEGIFNNKDQRCGIFGYCILSFPQNEKKIKKVRQSWSTHTFLHHIVANVPISTTLSGW